MYNDILLMHKSTENLPISAYLMVKKTAMW